MTTHERNRRRKALHWRARLQERVDGRLSQERWWLALEEEFKLQGGVRILGLGLVGATPFDLLSE